MPIQYIIKYVIYVLLGIYDIFSNQSRSISICLEEIGNALANAMCNEFSREYRYCFPIPTYIPHERDGLLFVSLNLLGFVHKKGSIQTASQTNRQDYIDSTYKAGLAIFKSNYI